MLDGDLASFLDFIRQHGDAVYSFLAIYSMANSLLLALFAGYAAHAGALGYEQALAACWAGTFAGDALRFWVGRRFGTRWLRGIPRLQRAVETAARLAARHHVWMILIHRYPRIIRNVAGFAYGASALSWPRFLVLNFVAAGLWAGFAVSIGYGFGFVSEKTMTDALSVFGIAMLVAFIALTWFLTRRLERVMERN
ncbi:DedA family protein [Reyranella sp.]|uniref:DedA family protein n=1 Tax=Reyranella sp. TaxID=1929291 RepID=UPI0027221AA2|nr:DedA family protein [Reyranella sp.]MDO8975990.1 DedA family protein [Reyranella sp.]MDP3242570.1 DedA family protein [Reyranella sp.]